MNGDAFDLEVAPVEPEARGGIEMKLANTELYLFIVQDFYSFAGCRAGPDAHNSAIKRRMVEVPKLRRGDGYLRREGPAFALGNRLLRSHDGARGTPVRRVQRYLQCDPLRRAGFVDRRAFNANCGLASSNHRRGNKRNPWLQMHIPHEDQPDGTIPFASFRLIFGLEKTTSPFVGHDFRGSKPPPESLFPALPCP